MAHTAGSRGSSILVPVLRTEDGIPNSVALATWHLALSNMIGVEVAHDLMGVWLFPAEGGAVLLGPEALAQDKVAIAVPQPRLTQDTLFELEELLRRSGYASSIAVPIRGRRADVGLLLFGDLRRAQYGPSQAIQLHALAQDLVSAFETLAEAPPYLSGNPLGEGVTLENLPTPLGEAAARATTGAELVRLVSGILHPLVPHDRLELLAGQPGSWTLLSGVHTRRRWGDQTTPAHQMVDALVQLVGKRSTVTVRDLRTEGSGVAWPTYLDSREGRRIRSVLGTRLVVGGHEVGYLFLGGVPTNLYRPEDEAVVERAAEFLGARVRMLHLSSEVDALRSRVAAQAGPVQRLAPLASVLATTAHWGEALRQFAGEVRQAISFERMQFILRMGDNEAVYLEPGDVRPLADLPLVPLEETQAVAILNGGASQIFRQEGDGEELLVPLRIAGRAVGAMRLIGGALGGDRVATGAAQQFADVIAPHLELLRREALPDGASRARRRAMTGIIEGS